MLVAAGCKHRICINPVHAAVHHAPHVITRATLRTMHSDACTNVPCLPALQDSLQSTSSQLSTTKAELLDLQERHERLRLEADANEKAARASMQEAAVAERQVCMHVCVCSCADAQVHPCKKKRVCVPASNKGQSTFQCRLQNDANRPRNMCVHLFMSGCRVEVLPWPPPCPIRLPHVPYASPADRTPPPHSIHLPCIPHTCP